MKIFYNSKIAKLFTFIDGYKTIMLFGAVFTERDAISLKAEYHEEAHCNQYHTMFCFGMFISLLTIGLCLLFGNAGWWLLAGVPDLVVAATVVELGEMHRENRRKVAMALF